MTERGYTREFAERIWGQIRGFGSYGFPESHAISFALLVYVSAWLKCYEPAAFACALVNSQPMGFYAPAQIVADVKRHNVEVRPVDVTASVWDCSLERRAVGDLALRLGLRMVKDLPVAAAERIVAARQSQAYVDIGDLVHRARLDQRARTALAQADALRSLADHRHHAHWAIAGVEDLPGFLNTHSAPETEVDLTTPTEDEDIAADYDAVGLSLRRHPVALLRPRFDEQGILTAEAFAQLPNGARVDVAGLVTIRQRPSTANGVIFVTLEDETGSINVIVWPNLASRHRRAVRGAGCGVRI